MLPIRPMCPVCAKKIMAGRQGRVSQLGDGGGMTPGNKQNGEKNRFPFLCKIPVKTIPVCPICDYVLSEDEEFLQLQLLDASAVLC